MYSFLLVLSVEMAARSLPDFAGGQLWLIAAHRELSNPHSIVLHNDNRTTFQLISYARSGGYHWRQCIVYEKSHERAGIGRLRSRAR